MNMFHFTIDFTGGMAVVTHRAAVVTPRSILVGSAMQSRTATACVQFDEEAPESGAGALEIQPSAAAKQASQLT